MRQSEFRKKVKEATEAELEVMLRQEREGLYKLRQQFALKQLYNVHAIKTARKNVARILTEMQLRRAGQSRG